MPETTTTEPTKIEFIQYHQPALKDGDYEITVTQTIESGAKMMTTQKLKALVNTVIKQSTLDSSQITDPTQKFSLIAGDKIEINDYKSADNNHWELELTTPVNEIGKFL